MVTSAATWIDVDCCIPKLLSPYSCTQRKTIAKFEVFCPWFLFFYN
uniref:Uncharacterized protein n=1 Tax=Rhizophora mucronata TaxID=61149 RepID=A0A2P2QVV5_RHIMU